jgi:hypothetical protein
LEGLPDYQPEAITKREAIRQLLPQIAQLQTKGYTVAAIAAQLRDQGLPVTRSVLQKWLRELRSNADSSPRHARQGGPDALAQQTRKDPLKRRGRPGTKDASVIAGSTQPELGSDASAAPAKTKAPPARDPIRETAPTGPASAFVLRPDSEEI